MKKMISVFFIIAFLVVNIFSAENSKVTYQKISHELFSSVNSSYQNYQSANKNLLIQKYAAPNKFIQSLADNRRIFYNLGLSFSIASGAFLLIGITGAILMGVSSNTAGLVSGARDNLWLAGAILNGIGFGFFGIFLLALIPMWVLYGLSFIDNAQSSTTTSKLQVVPVKDGFALAFKF